MQNGKRPDQNGDLKVSVINGSRLLDQYNDGQWKTKKVEPANNLAPGIHKLAAAQVASRNVHPKSYAGSVIHSDQRHVYQTVGKQVVRHDADLFKTPPKPGENYLLEYKRGQGVVKGSIDKETAEKLQNTKQRTL